MNELKKKVIQQKIGNYFRIWKYTKEEGYVFYGKADTYEEAKRKGADDIDYIDCEGHRHYVCRNGTIIW